MPIPHPYSTYLRWILMVSRCHFDFRALSFFPVGLSESCERRLNIFKAELKL